MYKDLSEDESEVIFSRIKKRIDIFDQTYSRFRDDSLVTRMSKETGIFELPLDAKEMLFLYRDLYLRTGSLVTPLIGNAISDAGYDKEYSLEQKKELGSPPEWEEAIEYRPPSLIVKKPVLLDFGAAGKGYLVDLVGKVLEENSIFEYMIDAGGDILHKGKEPIRIGLENPEDNTQAIGIYPLQNRSICGSAGNRRKWGTFTHIMNPKTLVSPTEIMAVWVIADTAMVADALATCLFFVPADSLNDAYDFEYILIRSDRSIEKSGNFGGEMFG